MKEIVIGSDLAPVLLTIKGRTGALLPNKIDILSHGCFHFPQLEAARQSGRPMPWVRALVCDGCHVRRLRYRLFRCPMVIGLTEALGCNRNRKDRCWTKNFSGLDC